MQREKLISTGKLFEQFKIRNIIRQFKNSSNLTPDEIETLLLIKQVNFN